MEETDQDLRYLTSGLEDLPQYLSSNNLFWPLGQISTPLTIGNLLFSLRRLLSNSRDEAAAQVLGRRLDQVRSANRALFQKKEQEEVSARVREWQNSVEDWQENGVDLPSLHTEMRNRVVLELLLSDLERVEIKTNLQIEGADQRFMEMTEAGEFISEKDLEKGFPQEPFWYLWRQPLGRKK